MKLFKITIIGFLVITIFFVFTSIVQAQSTGFLTDAVTTGFSVPENTSEGVVVKTIFKNVRKTFMQDRYLLLNNDPYIPGTMGVGDIFKVTNLATGESFTFDSNCLTKELPSMDLTYLVNPNAYNEFDFQVLKFEFINKCQTSKNIGEIYLYYKHVSEPFPFPSPVPAPSRHTDFKQTDPQWGSKHLNNSLRCGTLYGYGCAVTSVADVFHSYGKIVLANTSMLLNPGTLNDWLSDPANKGFSVCSIYWANASGAVKVGAPSIGQRKSSLDWVAGQQAIDNALAEGNLPILGVQANNSVGTHFLVVSEKLPNVNGKPDYRIVDPALYPFIANNPGKTGQSLSQAYGGFDKVFQYVIYKRSSNPQRTLAIGAHSPVQLIITDPFGNQTGFLNESGEVTENIPDSSYIIEPGIVQIDSSLPAAYEKKYFQQIDPSIGEYTVQVIGTGNGEYTIGFSKTDEQGNLSLHEVHGIAQTGVTETYQIQNTLDATIPVLVNKHVTFQNLNDNVNDLFSLNFITQKSVANSLIRNIEQAEKASVSGDINKVVQNLNQFINILERERGRKILEEAYLILLDNVNFLKGQYST